MPTAPPVTSPSPATTLVTVLPGPDPALRHRRRTAPARAVRVGRPPRPRVRPLADVLAELVRPVPVIDGLVVPGPRAAAAGPPPPSAAPDARAVALRLLQAVVEVADGVRPPAHLLRVCRAGVALDSVLAPGAPRPASRGALRGVRVCPVAPHALEVAGVVHRGGRARALAARLEHDGDAWRFAALTIL